MTSEPTVLFPLRDEGLGVLLLVTGVGFTLGLIEISGIIFLPLCIIQKVLKGVLMTSWNLTWNSRNNNSPRKVIYLMCKTMISKQQLYFKSGSENKEGIRSEIRLEELCQFLNHRINFKDMKK